jgi:enoyl-CoA hydratase
VRVNNRLKGPALTDYQFVTYEVLHEGRIARVMMNRPEARNAQNAPMLRELDDALRRAEADDTARVGDLVGHGKSFSCGHDMSAGRRAAKSGSSGWGGYLDGEAGSSRPGLRPLVRDEVAAAATVR